MATVAHLAGEAYDFHQTLAEYRATPLHDLPGLAADLGLAALHLKDESPRFGLGAFKALGASFAAQRWLSNHPDRQQVVFVTATDGNHGRAVAWSARRLGAEAVVFIPAHAAPARIDAIVAEGAEVILVPEGYDAAVQAAHQAARAHGWAVIQDTATPGYEDIPDWIAAGYWTHAREIETTLHPPGRPAVDLVVLHAGVGTWAAGIAAYYWHRYGAARPRLAVVEPVTAACLLAGAVSGRPVPIDASRRTIMAGLDCALASTTALAMLHQSVDAFFTIDDRWARTAMRRLAMPKRGDPRVVAGESGAAGLAGLLALTDEAALAPVARHLGVGASSRVLVWSTEGATDPIHWQEVVGQPIST